jgi:hypothetical protein
LQDAYDGGQTILLSGAKGSLVITLDEVDMGADFTVTGPTGDYFITDWEALTAQVGSATINASLYGLTVGITSEGTVDVNADTSITLDAATASHFTVTGTGQDLTLSSVGGSVIVQATENATDAIRIYASGTSSGIDIDGTGAITIDSSLSSIGIGTDAHTGAIDIGTSATARTITIGSSSSLLLDLNAGSGGVDVDTSGVINLTTTSTTPGAIVLNASTTSGGMQVNLGTSGLDLYSTGVVIIESTKDEAGAVYLYGSNATAGNVWVQGAGTGSAAVRIYASNAVGGIDIDAGTQGIDIASTVAETAKVLALSSLGTNGNSTNFFVGESDPSAGSGVVAPVSSTFYRNSGGTDTVGELWLKTGAGNTAWTKLGTGGGGVAGPGSSTDSAIALWDGTDGDTLKNSTITIDGSGNMAGISSVTMTERASQPTMASGTGALWTRNDTPSVPVFTDDTSVDYSVLHYSPVKRPCRVATTANVATLSGGAPLVVDGVTLVTGDRVLVWNQSTASQNGIYKVTTPGTGSDGTWTRDADFDDATKDHVTAGIEVYVQEGDSYSRTKFFLTTTGAITIGSTSLEFVPMGGLARTDASSTEVIASTAFTTGWNWSSAINLRDYSEIAIFFNPTAIGSNTQVDIAVQWSDDGSTIA